MGMSLCVVGLRDENSSLHKKMVRVLDALRDLGESENLPVALVKYFGRTYDDDDLPDLALEVELKSTEWGDEDRAGLEILVSEIPEGVKKIRFYNSW